MDLNLFEGVQETYIVDSALSHLGQRRRRFSAAHEQLVEVESDVQ